MDLTGWALVGYIAACIAVPAGWGALCAWLFSRSDNAEAGGDSDPQSTPRSSVDYMI